jgi:hypothetical protein
MSWLLKQAEDILNRVDQQTNAAIHQHSAKSTSNQPIEESISDVSSIKSTKRLSTASRRTKNNDDVDLIDYLNSPTPVNNKPNRPVQLITEAARTASVPDMFATDSSKTTERSSSKSASGTPRSITPAAQHHDDDQGLVLVRLKHKYFFDLRIISFYLQNFPSTQEFHKTNTSDIDSDRPSDLKDEIISSLHTEIQTLVRDKGQYEHDLQTYKRQQIQHQHQIAESDALLRDLRARESDFNEALAAKDSQVATLRIRLAEADDLVKSKTAQCEHLQNQCARILQDHTDSSGIQSHAVDSLQSRIIHLEQQLQQRANEYERLIEDKHLFEKRANDERQQLIDQLKLTEKRLNDERLQMLEQQQQTKHAKNLIHQLEQDNNEYKVKAQRILQTKDKLITKLKEIAQHRNNLSSTGDHQGRFEKKITSDR